MRCPNCDFENPLDTKFCGECGAPLKNICPNCGFENPPRFKFCGECATSLARKETQDFPSVPGSGAPEGERRQLTVMFCDLVGSTALSEQLDPEELRDVMRRYQHACAEVINRYDGHVAKYLGDGILIYFGYPRAHEDDAKRSVHAALEIVDEVKKQSNSLLNNPDINLAVRLGIHTGLVVVGEMGAGQTREAMAVVGETPNIAARLQEKAAPNTVVISSATHRLIQGYFDCHALGSFNLRGITKSIELHEVVKEGERQSRLEVASSKGLTPLVGREQEAGLLLQRWEQVKEGEGQVVLISGEAGIGKSRLVQVLKAYVQGEPHARIENRCSSYYQNTALYPVIDHLERLLAFKRPDSHQQRINKLEKILETYGLPVQDLVPLFASLLSIPLTDKYPPLNLSPQRQKQKTFEALLAWLIAETEQKPVLYIVEDLHWVDPSTLEYLSLLVQQVPTARILTLFCFRPDFKPPWAMRSHFSQIMLSRLGQKQVELMVGRVAGGKMLPEEMVQQIISKTDGVPLYVEEITKMVLESGLLREEGGQYVLDRSLPTLAIPATLQDSLTARLDRLGTAKEIAQLGATLGREFTYDLLRAVSPLDEQDLQIELSKLVKAELVYQRGIPPQARYFIKHALIQEAAHGSLLKSRRQQYHRTIAQVLEDQFPESSETQPELLAHHYTKAGLLNQAIPYWHRAGQRATERSAHVEAIGHLKKGLELIKTITDATERNHQELDLQTALGLALMATKGYADPEVEKAYARALELCEQVEKTPQLFPVLDGLRLFYNVRGEYRTAHELAEQFMHQAQNVRDPALMVEAHRVLGATLFWLGELIPARDQLEQAITLYDPQQHRSLAFVYGQDPAVACLSYAARTLWLLGYPEQALKRSHEAIKLAQELSHPHSLAYALLHGATFVHLLRRDGQAAQETAEEGITVCTEQGFALWLAWGTFMRGWALAEEGQGEKGIAQMRRGLAASRDTGSEISRSYFLALLAESYGKTGESQDGLSLNAEALAEAQKSGEGFYEAELYRLKGEFLQMRGETEDRVGESLHRAIEVARRRSAKSLELRAVMSLSRLWQKQGKKVEAREMLAETYGWFTEGFETKDLKEAKSLLELLS